jgi:hypothetical protein
VTSQHQPSRFICSGMNLGLTNGEHSSNDAREPKQIV